jgi:hypothetical protein
MQLGFQRGQLGEQVGIAALPHRHRRHGPILEQGTDNPGHFTPTQPEK